MRFQKRSISRGNVALRRAIFSRGSILIEVVVAASILSAVSRSVIGAFSSLGMFHQRNMYSIKGSLLAEEGIEVARLIKSMGWSSLSSLSGSPAYLSIGTSTWSATTTPEVVDGVFYRTLRVYPVSRDALDDVATSSGSVDPNTLFLESEVSWSWRNSTSSVSYKAYVTNI